MEFEIWTKDGNNRKLYKDANMIKASWERPIYKHINENEGMVEWQTPMPMYIKMRKEQTIAIPADKEPRIPKKKLSLDEMMDELLQEKEQAIRRECEQKVRSLEKQNMNADITKTEYAQLKEGYENQLLMERQKVETLMAERDHLSQMNLLHRSDKRELEKERDEKAEEIRRWEELYVTAEIEQKKAIEGKRKAEDSAQRYRKEISKKNKEIAYYKRSLFPRFENHLECEHPGPQTRNRRFDRIRGFQIHPIRFRLENRCRIAATSAEDPLRQRNERADQPGIVRAADWLEPGGAKHLQRAAACEETKVRAIEHTGIGVRKPAREQSEPNRPKADVRQRDDDSSVRLQEAS